MKLLILDFNVLLSILNPKSQSTKTFEIYYHICRLLELDISKEACFRLYTRYVDNYGKMKDYLSIMKKGTDKKRFDEEFFRRFKQLYFHDDHDSLEQRKKMLQESFSKIAEQYIIALTASGNQEFIKYTLSFYDLGKFINSFKTSEYLTLYDEYIHDILQENISADLMPDEIAICLTKYQTFLRSYLESEKALRPYNIVYKEWNEIVEEG